MHRFIITLTCILVASLLYTQCAHSIVSGDQGGSEITNGAVISMAGLPASGIVVTAYPLAYIAGNSAQNTVITTFTNDTGGFVLPIVSGNYNLYIADSTCGGNLMRNVGAHQNLGTIRLDSLGYMEGTIHTDSAQNAPLTAYCKGTPLRVPLAANNGFFSFNLIPAGTYTLSIAKISLIAGCTPGFDCQPGTGALPLEVAVTSIIVQSGRTVVIDTLISMDSTAE